MISPPIRIHVCISGFTQSENRFHGVLKLSEELHEAGYGNTQHGKRVYLRPWNYNWSAFAESLWTLGEVKDQEILINVYAYSWGVGYGAKKFAQELKKRGLRINCLVSSDGVYRHRWLKFPSLLGRDSSLSPRIELPDNVDEVYCIHQTQNRPQGHEITAVGRVHSSIEIKCDHQYMDDDGTFHSMALNAAAKLERI